MFFKIMVLGGFLVFLQGAFAYRDRYFNQYQMRGQGIHNGYSFLQQGAMWADICVIPPIVGFILSKYRLPFTSFWGIALGVIAAVITGLMVRQYAAASRTIPEAHAQGGRTSVTGWIHALYAWFAIWIFGLIYLSKTVPTVSTYDLLFVSGLMIPFFFLGIVKFSCNWEFKKHDQFQVAGLTIFILGMTAIKIYLI
jgi:hypothetical protein